MDRRQFLCAAAASGLAANSSALLAQEIKSKRFTLAYAPHFGMFANSAGEDLLENIDRCLSGGRSVVVCPDGYFETRKLRSPRVT